MIYIFILLDSQKIFFFLRSSEFRSPKLQHFKNKSGIWYNTNL
nr:MAG TPA: hypothetical protein [Caudoviricetes sp.]